MYPENPAIGESYLNSAQGIVECELTRNSSQHETLTAKDTFDALQQFLAKRRSAYNGSDLCSDLVFFSAVHSQTWT